MSAKFSILFKADSEQDKKIYDIMEACEEKTAFMKNAIFSYILNIEKGNIIDRLYPYDKVSLGNNSLPLQNINTYSEPSNIHIENNYEASSYEDEYIDDGYEYEDEEQEYTGNYNATF
ncbi:MAG: hypothetical protein ACRCX2_22525 [Paraclostridium sp.]